MSKKLWTANVTCDFEMAIYAETLDEALKIAKRHAPEELDNIGDVFDVVIMDMVPPPDLNYALPWGDFGSEPERTVRELKAELGVKHPLEARMADLANALKAKATD